MGRLTAMEKAITSMNGGDDTKSYAKNSKFQEQAWKRAQVHLITSIQENLEIPKNSQVFSIAELGCSVGPNTFLAVQNIIDAILDHMKRAKGLPEPEFLVFYNDHVMNDFNTLFKNLPVNRNYMAASLPGSFYSQIFPKASMNFMNASFALHFLTEVPDEVMEEDSPAWNKGRVSYGLSSGEVVNSYALQFSKDLDAFFGARSVELASGGLMSILVPCREDGSVPSDSIILQVLECLGNALIDMVNEDLLEEELLDSFNLPIYLPTPSEIQQVVANYKHLAIKRMELVYQEKEKLGTPACVQFVRRHIRAITEGILTKHFGSEIVDELFQRYPQKLEEYSRSAHYADQAKKPTSLFLLLKSA